MMDFSGLFEMQGTLFLIMLLGMFLRKKRIIHDGGKTMLSSLVIDVTLPASIIKSFEIEFNKEILISCMAVCIAAFLIQAGTAALSSFLSPGISGQSQKGVKILYHLFQCRNSWQSYSGRHIWQPWTSLCCHLLHSSANFHVDGRPYLFYGST